MGTYYNVANHTKCEWLDPAKVGGGAIKSGCFGGSFGRLVLWAISPMGPWRGDHVVVLSDAADEGEYNRVEKDYLDVTAATVRRMNRGVDQDAWGLFDVPVELREDGEAS